LIKTDIMTLVMIGWIVSFINLLLTGTTISGEIRCLWLC